jgi:gliding motility-associated protein GldE
VAFLIVLLAQVLPRTWATNHKIWFASSFSLSIEILNSIFNGLSNRFVRYSENIEKKGILSASEGEEENNLDHAIDLLTENEASVEEKQILKGIRKFSGTHVRQVMRTRLDVSGIDASFSFHKILKVTRDLHYSRLPVYRSSLDEIIGILHIKDLLPHLSASDDFNWHQLIRTPYFVHEQKLIEDLLQDFRNKRTHFAIVVDEFGGTSGIVTLEDILEEVIGDIKDEFDDEESMNIKIDDFNYIFEGKTMISDVCKMIRVPVNTFDDIRGDSDSLAGLVLEIAGEFPVINEPLQHSNFTFTTLEISKNRIDKVRLTIDESSSDTDHQ